MKIKIITFVLLTLLIWLTGFIAYSGYSLLSKPKDTNQTSDAIVVLTGGKGRIGNGLELFARGKANHLFISGVNEDYSPARIRRIWKGNTALPQCCVYVGKSATTTIENAIETRNWAKQHNIQSIRLVTSNYHMSRALLELKAAMPDIRFTKHPIAQDNFGLKDLYFWQLLFSEYHKYVWRHVVLLVIPYENAKTAS